MAGPPGLPPTTTRATFAKAVEAFLQTKTDLKQLHVRQHEVAWPLIAVTSDRIISAYKTSNKPTADCDSSLHVDWTLPRHQPAPSIGTLLSTMTFQCTLTFEVETW